MRVTGLISVVRMRYRLFKVTNEEEVGARCRRWCVRGGKGRKNICAVYLQKYFWPVQRKLVLHQLICPLLGHAIRVKPRRRHQESTLRNPAGALSKSHLIGFCTLGIFDRSAFTYRSLHVFCMKMRRTYYDPDPCLFGGFILGSVN